MTELVMVSLEQWDNVWRRNQHLVAGLLESDPTLRVLFVEPATDPLHDISTGVSPRRGRGLRLAPPVVGVGSGQLWLYEPTKWLPRRLDPALDRRWARGVARAARRAGFHAPALWANSPSGAHLRRHTGWAALYDVTDDWLAAQRTSREHDRLVFEEGDLLRHCKEVVVCSPSLEQTMRDRGATRVTLIPNAVDVGAYRRSPPRPTDLPRSPIAVYVGTLHRDRLDVDLCELTARQLGPEGHLVLVGPDRLPPADHDRLTRAGVLILGAKSHTDVPAYLMHADVLVVPHVVDDFTDSLDPIKVYEYLAAARPVVSTPVAGFRETEYVPVTVAEGADFARAVQREALDPSPIPSDNRLETLPTWAQRVAAMRDVVTRLRSR